MGGYENRRFTRVEVSAPVKATLSCPPEMVLAQLRDISANGLSMHTPKRLPLGSACKVSFYAAPEKVVNVEGTVVRADGLSLAIEFRELRSDDLQKLRAFIVSHADDPHALDIEIVSRSDLLPKSD